MLRSATSLFSLLGALDTARRKKKNCEEHTTILALRSALRDLLLFTFFELGSLQYATTEACGDGRVYQAGVIRMPPTNFTAIDDCVEVDVCQT